MPIEIRNLNYSYDSQNEIFKNLNVKIDENWKLGLIGKNGAGKTTLLKLINEHKLKEISTNLLIKYFPIALSNKNLTLQEIIDEEFSSVESWKIYREMNLLDLSLDKLMQNFESLSGGEKVKFQLALLFAEEDCFVLLDEPTNHLDEDSKEKILSYLNNKKGFILTSHDRWLLDNTIDHTLILDNKQCEVQKGNYSTWEENYNRKIEYEKSQNEIISKEIQRLEMTKEKNLKWAGDAERAKNKNNNQNQAVLDRGYFGSKAAKAMKRAKAVEDRIDSNIEKKKELLLNVEKEEDVKLFPLTTNKNKTIISCKKINAVYGEKQVFNDLSFEIKDGDRIALKGKNGSGKSTLIKILLGLNPSYKGEIFKKNNLKISYVTQEISNLKGSIQEFAQTQDINLTVLLTLLKKLGVKREVFDNDIRNLSDGQKKKLLLASSLATPADLYIWDEPFNFIDIFTRIKIENLILKYKPTMIFVEHDKFMIDKLATKIIQL